MKLCLNEIGIEIIFVNTPCDIYYEFISERPCGCGSSESSQRAYIEHSDLPSIFA